jgi:prepilin-type N-terminal cleavage/methylation domain-containing protein
MRYKYRQTEKFSQRKKETAAMRLGFTLAELMVVIAIVGALTAAVYAFLRTSNRTWQVGRDRLSEFRQARMAVNEMDRLLRQANPLWDATHGASISDANQRIDFYIPEFYNDCCPACADPALCQDIGGNVHTRGEVRSLVKVTFKLNPNNTTQLLEKVGTDPERVIANNVAGINFACGCSGCTAVDNACPAVDTSITIQVQSQHQLSAKTLLRNQNVSSQGAIIQEPPQGEF